MGDGSNDVDDSGGRGHNLGRAVRYTTGVDGEIFGDDPRIHTVEIAGVVGRLLALATGLALAGAMTLGVLLWLVRRRSRAVASHRSGSITGTSCPASNLQASLDVTASSFPDTADRRRTAASLPREGHDVGSSDQTPEPRRQGRLP